MIKYIDKKQYGLLVPCIFNKEECLKKGYITDKELNENYYNLMSIYSYYVEQYINNILGIKNIEEKIDTDNPDFCPIKENGKDLYQSISNNKYFYIRNTFYVEYLNEEDAKYLLSKTDGILDNKIVEIIGRTFLTLVRGNITGNITNESLICYGLESSSSFLAPIFSLVLGFRVSDEDEDKYGEGDEWFDYKDKKEKYISELLEKLNVDFTKKLGINVHIIDYSEIGFIVKDNSGEMSMGTTFRF